MNPARHLLRRPVAPRAVLSLRSQSLWARHSSTGQQPPKPEQTPPPPGPEPQPSSGASKWSAGRLTGIFLGSALAFYATTAYLQTNQVPVPEKPERPKRKAKPKPVVVVEDPEKERQLINTQHVQVAHSWESPGVWAWGSNEGRVVDPEDEELDGVVKAPKRIAFFDGKVLRDLKLTKDVGVAVTEKGDLVQWGLGFSSQNPRPTPTLTGKDIVKVAVTEDRIIALCADGAVYSLPASRHDQAAGRKPLEEPKPSSWSGLWSSGPSPPTAASVAYRNVTPSGLYSREKVVDISGGREHCLMLTSRGRVFAAAASTLGFPSRGQLGIPGLSWVRRPADRPYDAPHEIVELDGRDVVKVAAGDYHSVALDNQGHVWAWGDNTFGQLGFDNKTRYPVAESPVLMRTNELLTGTGLVPKVTDITAGGTTTYFTTDGAPASLHTLASSRPVADLWACGQGINGQLGNGRWLHVSGAPTKVKNLSGLSEYDEQAKSLVPIRLSSISAGTTHACAVMANVTRTSAPLGAGGSGDTDTNWGADVMVWGGNEHYQLGTGRRTNSNKPVHIAPLEAELRATTTTGGKGLGSGGGAAENGLEASRMQLAPRSVAKIGGRKVSVEQRMVCGEYVTAVYSAT